MKYWTVTKDLWNAKFYCRNSSFNIVCKYSNISLANIQISQALILFANIQISRGRGVYISQTKHLTSGHTVMKMAFTLTSSSAQTVCPKKTTRTEEWKQFQTFFFFLCKTKEIPCTHMIRNQNPIIPQNFANTTRQISLKRKMRLHLLWNLMFLFTCMLVLNVKNRILDKLSLALNLNAGELTKRDDF